MLRLIFGLSLIFVLFIFCHFKVVTKDCGETATSDQLWNKGCFPKMKNQFFENIDKIGGSALGIAVIQMIGVIIACCTGKKMNARLEPPKWQTLNNTNITRNGEIFPV